MLSTPTAFGEDSSFQGDQPQPAIVIVHGAWGGGHHWKSVEHLMLKQHNRPVHRVTLTGLGERTHLASKDTDLSTHIQDVINVIDYEELAPIILIGHSYGGAVVSGVADAMPGKISQLIYLDAHVLEDGESYLTLKPKMLEDYALRAKLDGDGWLIPVDWENKVRDVPHPLATLTSPIKLTNPERLEIPTTFWLFADGKPAEQDDRYVFLQRSQKLNWDTKVFPWNHNPHRDRPDDFVNELIKIIR